MDISAYIEQCMKQLGVEKYSFRTYYKKIGHNTTLPGGKYYFLDLAGLLGYQINANNIMFSCNDIRRYEISHYSPIFAGQVHIISIGGVKPRALETDAEPLHATTIPIVEITPL